MSGTSHSSLSLIARIALLLLVLSPFALAIPRLTTTETQRALKVAPPPPASGPATRAAVEPPTTFPATTAAAQPGAKSLPRPILGFAINCHHISDLPAYLRAVDSIADLGANTLIVITPMFQRRVDSSVIRRVRAKCPRDEQLIAILDRAKHHELATILMPIVLIEKPRGSEWRGVIEPDDWDRWWSSYDELIDRFIAIADRCEVDILSIGSELNTTEAQFDRWQRVAERVRASFDGLITYSSNWDRYDRVELWPLVDVISVSSYFELERETPGAAEAALVEAWSGPRARLTGIAVEWNRPLLISEIGYPSLPWANAYPWNYVAKGEAADHEMQARCWRAFFRAWTDTLTDSDSPIVGFCGYRWDPYHRGGRGDTGYGIVGKPSMQIIRHGLATIRKAAQREESERATASSDPPRSAEN
jgi:hypothetical protein